MYRNQNIKLTNRITKQRNSSFIIPKNTKATRKTNPTYKKKKKEP